MAVATPTAVPQRVLDYERTYVAENPGSQRLYAEAVQVFPSGVTHDNRYLMPFPISCTRAEGAYKWDVDGHRLIDYLVGHGALLLGHSHPGVVRAVQEQVATVLAEQICHRLVIGLIQTLLTILVGVLLFRFTIIGNLALVAGVIVLGTLTFIALGYLIAGLAGSPESVNGVTQIFGVPMMFLSGLFTPIELMPAWLRPVATVLPLTYLADALRQTMVGATPVFGLVLDFGVLAAWLVVCAALAVRFFRWE